MSYTQQQLADLYGLAVSAEAAGDHSTEEGYVLDDAVVNLAPNYGGLIRVLIDQLRAAGRRPAGETPDPGLVAEHCATMEAEGDMVAVPRGLLGAALGAISHPQHAASATVGALKHYAYSQPKQTGTVKPEIWSDYYSRTMCKKPKLITGPLEHAYKELTPQIMRNLLDCFERYGTLPGDMVAIQALRIALDGIERREKPTDLVQQYSTDQWWFKELQKVVIESDPAGKDSRRALYGVVVRMIDELNGKPAINTGLRWTDYKGISDRAPVHEALQGFTEDATEDNAINLIRAIAEALRPRPRFWVDVHGYQTYLLWSEADAVKHCNETGGLYVLPLFAGEPINTKLPMRMCRPAEEPQTVEVSALLRNLQAIPQKYTSDHVSLGEVFAVIEALRAKP